MAWIRTIPPDEAEGELRDLYARIDAAGHVAHIFQVQSLHPKALAAHREIYRTLMFGPSPLSRAEREMVATVVSADNGCHY